MNRRGVSVLMIVVALSLAIGLIVMAVHQLWRGSSRSLFAVQEHRELVNFCHSAASEALWIVEAQLEQGASKWVDWCATVIDVQPREQKVDETHKYVSQLTPEGSNLTYTISAVTLKRVKGLPSAEGLSGGLGILDFEVTAEAHRATPVHHAKVKMTRRHAFWFSDSLTPFSQGGRHIEILPTPVSTWLEYP